MTQSRWKTVISLAILSLLFSASLIFAQDFCGDGGMWAVLDTIPPCSSDSGYGDRKDHYGDIFDHDISDVCLAELFLFRGWTAQFGYRIFSSDRTASERLIGETVNLMRTLGIGLFETTHDVSVEATLGSDFLTLLDNRWGSYDLEVSTMPISDRIPAPEIVAVLTERLEVHDAAVSFGLSTTFLAQLDFIKRTALGIGLLRLSRK